MEFTRLPFAAVKQYFHSYNWEMINENCACMCMHKLRVVVLKFAAYAKFIHICMIVVKLIDADMELPLQPTHSFYNAIRYFAEIYRQWKCS